MKAYLTLIVKFPVQFSAKFLFFLNEIFFKTLFVVFYRTNESNVKRNEINFSIERERKSLLCLIHKNQFYSETILNYLLHFLSFISV